MNKYIYLLIFHLLTLISSASDSLSITIEHSKFAYATNIDPDVKLKEVQEVIELREKKVETLIKEIIKHCALNVKEDKGDDLYSIRVSHYKGKKSHITGIFFLGEEELPEIVKRQILGEYFSSHYKKLKLPITIDNNKDLEIINQDFEIEIDFMHEGDESRIVLKKVLGKYIIKDSRDIISAKSLPNESLDKIATLFVKWVVGKDLPSMEEQAGYSIKIDYNFNHSNADIVGEFKLKSIKNLPKEIVEKFKLHHEKVSYK